MLMTLVLVLLNMKWPVLIYYGGLVISVFIYTERWPYIKAVAGGVGLIGVYLLVSAFVFRLAPTPTVVVPAPVAPAAVESHDVAPQPKLETPVITEQRDKVNVSGTVDAAASNAPMLLFAALNRMAIAYPYYYEIFTKEGAVCGGVLDQLQVGKACRPSTFVYERIFGRDGFEGRGTSPAPVHVSGYALGGWMVAMFALLCASIILGLFASLPLDANAAVGALGITGAIAGYHFSQLPGEGPLIYDHGVVWVVLLLALYALYRVAVKRLSIKICN
ncbi:hypothetical protein DM872_01825 [Pseudomonas taiwanensis]|nr:hypothetical protein [Pseudomonas taiwanensis]